MEASPKKGRPKVFQDRNIDRIRRTFGLSTDRAGQNWDLALDGRHVLIPGLLDSSPGGKDEILKLYAASEFSWFLISRRRGSFEPEPRWRQAALIEIARLAKVTDDETARAIAKQVVRLAEKKNLTTKEAAQIIRDHRLEKSKPGPISTMIMLKRELDALARRLRLAGVTDEDIANGLLSYAEMLESGISEAASEL